MNAVTRFNDVLALRATKVFGTVWVFYACFLYGFIPLLFPKEMTTLLYWSNSVQLWSLPLLMVGTNLQGRDSEKRALETHDAVMKEVEILTGIVRDVHAAVTPSTP